MIILIIFVVSQCMCQFFVQILFVWGVCFGVKCIGCFGFVYVVDLVDELVVDDQLFDIDGVFVVVDVKSLLLVDGIVIDFQCQGFNVSFVFYNFNVIGECGCGESFMVS